MEKSKDQIISENQTLVESWQSMPVNMMERHGFSRKVEKADNLNFLEHIQDPWQKYTAARLLENARQELVKMDETVRMHHVGGFEKFIFPTIAAVFGNLILEDLVSVQPLSAPSGLVFYLDVLAGSNKGKVKRGDKLYQSIGGPLPTTHYSDEVVEDELLALGTGATPTFSGNLSYLPVRPGTLVLTAGALKVSDDGNGNLVGNTAAGTNTINYATGAYNVTFSANPATDVEITATYTFDSELSDQVPEMDIRMTSSNVMARTNKLKTQWSVESAQDLKQLHGLDVEPTVLGYTTNEIQREITNRVVKHLLQVAAAGQVTWDRTPPSGVQWYFHKQQIRDVLIEGSGLIRQATRRWRANWMVCDVEITSILRTVDGFTSVAPPSNVAGVYKAGEIDGITIYEDPDMTPRTGLYGRKGSTFIESGYVFAPYLGVFTTETIILPDFKARKGLMYRAGQKLVDASQYGIFKLTQS